MHNECLLSSSVFCFVVVVAFTQISFVCLSHLRHTHSRGRVFMRKVMLESRNANKMERVCFSK